MYKKVYVEITNTCNLKCSFCTLNKRPCTNITLDNFNIILNKLENHTKYLYLHVLGEPLMHPKINDLINLASQKYYINLTTNGYLINKIIANKNIRQINISLHSFNPCYGITLEDYLNNIFAVADNLSQNTYISYRLWVKNKYSKEIVDAINKKYQTTIDYKNIPSESKIADKTYLNTHREFIWPNMEQDIISKKGTCYALRDHIAILVDGTIVPCCLDGDGIIKLGNIYQDNLKDIINSTRYQNMLTGFKNNYKCEGLCQRCNFIQKNND